MLLGSKCDSVLLNDFNFDGKPKSYLVELPINEARVIFMLRYRMIPTKINFHVSRLDGTKNPNVGINAAVQKRI